MIDIEEAIWEKIFFAIVTNPIAVWVTLDFTPRIGYFRYWYLAWINYPFNQVDLELYSTK